MFGGGEFRSSRECVGSLEWGAFEEGKDFDERKANGFGASPAGDVFRCGIQMNDVTSVVADQNGFGREIQHGSGILLVEKCGFLNAKLFHEEIDYATQANLLQV